MQLVFKISNLCDHNPPTSQTDRQTDGRHAIPRPRICTKVHCAVKIQCELTLSPRVNVTSAWCLDIIDREKWEREFCHIDKWVTEYCIVLPYHHTHGLSCDLKAVVVIFTHGLDIELSVGLLPTLLFPHSAFYPPFRIHFHIFRFRILLSAFRNSAFYQWPLFTCYPKFVCLFILKFLLCSGKMNCSVSTADKYQKTGQLIITKTYHCGQNCAF